MAAPAAKCSRCNWFNGVDPLNCGKHKICRSCTKQGPNCQIPSCIKDLQGISSLTFTPSSLAAKTVAVAPAPSAKGDGSAGALTSSVGPRWNDPASSRSDSAGPAPAPVGSRGTVGPRWGDPVGAEEKRGAPVTKASDVVGTFGARADGYAAATREQFPESFAFSSQPASSQSSLAPASSSTSKPAGGYSGFPQLDPKRKPGSAASSSYQGWGSFGPSSS